MSTENHFLRQWKAKKDLESDKFNSLLIENSKIFSSTALEVDKTESFKLELSDSNFVNESTKHTSLNEQQKEDSVVIISDSSDDCIENIGYRNRNVRNKYFRPIPESSDDQSPEQEILSKNIRSLNVGETSDDEIQDSRLFNNHKNIAICSSSVSTKSKSSNRSKLTNERKVVIIEETESEYESDSEVAKIHDVLRETITESAALSARKKRDILKWLSSNFNNSSKLTSSFSQASIISDSRKSSITSDGASSLERFELNHETPNNRGKVLSKPSTVEKSNKKKSLFHLEAPNNKDKIIKPSTLNPSNNKSVWELDKTQSRIDEYFPKKNTVNLNISKDVTPVSQPIRRKPHTIISETESSSNGILSHLNTNHSNSPRTITPKSQVTNANTYNSNEIQISDCENILDKLYGSHWRQNANKILPSTEPKKPPTKKVVRNIQTEKKPTKAKKNYKNEIINSSKSDSDDNSRKENISNKIKKKYSKIPVYQGSKVRKNPKKDSFIKDSTSSESSPNCTYYTALTDLAITEKVNQPLSDKLKYPRSEKHNFISNGNWRNNHIQQKKLSFSSDSSTSEFDPEDIVFPKSPIKKTKKIISGKVSATCQKPKSFIASLSANVPINLADPKALIFRTKYKTKKEELCKYLFNLFNEKIFNNQLPEDMTLEWNNRMRNTAGYCYNKKSVKALGTITRSSRIVLATKILDTPERLRDTLVHELCHAATWLVNEVSDGHGPFWKAWAKKAMNTFPELPPIKRCHDYDIKTKYTYKCTTCGYSIGRHSKSLDTTKKRCGYCHGTFELLINTTTKTGDTVQKKSTRSTPSAFAMYVKENYQNVKKQKVGIKHGEIMKVLGQQFASVKITPITKPSENKETENDE